MSCKLSIPYGVTDFKRIRRDGYYYVDKTSFIAPMEERVSFIFFVRPRRFGKTLLIDMLKCYYDIAEKNNFRQLFGDLAVGRAPTPGANRYWVLTLNFSKVAPSETLSLEGAFSQYMGMRLGAFVRRYADAVAQLKRYAADPHLPALAAGTPVHFLCYEFKGRDLYRFKEIV